MPRRDGPGAGRAFRRFPAPSSGICASGASQKAAEHPKNLAQRRGGGCAPLSPTSDSGCTAGLARGCSCRKGKVPVAPGAFPEEFQPWNCPQCRNQIFSAPGAESLLSPLPLLPGMVTGAKDQIRAPRGCSGMKEPPKIWAGGRACPPGSPRDQPRGSRVGHPKRCTFPASLGVFPSWLQSKSPGGMENHPV